MWPGNEGIELPTPNDDDNLLHELDSCEALLSFVMADPMLCENPAFKEAINYLTEGVDDVRHHHSISYDREARVGHKSAETSFIGYKTHIAMTPERIITAATVTSGEKGDGPMLPDLINKTEQAGVVVDTIVGDAAYSGIDNLRHAKENGIEIISRLNPVIVSGNRIDGESASFTTKMLVGIYAQQDTLRIEWRSETGRKKGGAVRYGIGGIRMCVLYVR